MDTNRQPVYSFGGKHIGWITWDRMKQAWYAEPNGRTRVYGPFAIARLARGCVEKKSLTTHVK